MIGVAVSPSRQRGQSAAGQNYTANATNAITSNASNRINAGPATSSSINNLIGQGINGLSYYYGSRR